MGEGRHCEMVEGAEDEEEEKPCCFQKQKAN
jgi:hypothetical protein